MSTISKIKQLNIDRRSHDIVNGYISNLKTRYFCGFIIPSTISTICLSFIGDHFMLTQGEYQWEITHPKVLRSIYHHSKPSTTSQHKSPVFQIAKLNWQIVLYPNGWNDKNKGNVFPCLQLISMPTAWKSVTIERTIIAPQFGVHSIAMSEYSNNQSYPWEQGILSLKDLKSMINAENNLSFGVKIKILNVRLKKDNLLYYHHKFDYKQQHKLSWNIPNEIISKLNQCTTGRRYSSNVYNNMWTMQLCPNGFNRKNKGQCMLRLALCALPENVSKIRAQWIVSCKELSYKSINTKDFEYDHGNFGISLCKTGTFNKLKTVQIGRNNKIKSIKCGSYLMNGLTLNVEILILKEWDYDGNEVYHFGGDEWDSFVAEHNEKQKLQENNSIYKKVQNSTKQGSKTEGMDKIKSEMDNLMVENRIKSNKINMLQQTVNELRCTINNMSIKQEQRDEEHADLMKKMDLLMSMMHYKNCELSESRTSEAEPFDVKIDTISSY